MHGSKITIVCKNCGTIKKVRPDRATFCSRECAFEYKKRKCVKCGGVLYGGKNKKYCSDKCLNGYVHSCPRCGEVLYGRKNNRYCGRNECHDENVLSNKDRGYKQLHVNICEYCGDEYSVAFYAGRRKYCDNCIPKVKRAAKQQAARVRHARLKAARRNQFINSRRVFLRDNYVCYLCGEETSRKYRPTDMKSPTVDHIVPLAKGGDNTYDNVSTAHLICNSYKSDNHLKRGGVEMFRRGGGRPQVDIGTKKTPNVRNS